MELNVLTILIFVACLALSFLFSGMEAGVFALSRLRIRQQMRAGNPSARLLHGYLENPENFLWSILVGNTVVNFAVLGAVIGVLHNALSGRRLWFVGIFAGVVFLFYALCDLLPKMLFRLHPNRYCLALARPFRFAHLGLRPLVSMVESCSRLVLRWTGGKTYTGRLFGNREELRLLMQESAQAFSSEERAMINRVLDLQNLAVRQVATPLTQAATVNTQTPVREVLALCRERHLTRLPVWELRDGQQRIVGLLNLNTLLHQAGLSEEKPVAEFVKPAIYLEEDMRLEVALRRLQRGGQRLAVVLGRDGHEIGIVSLQDILKVIFGEVSL
jgi:CBS domain containing-hemolysin-like protein